MDNDNKRFECKVADVGSPHWNLQTDR